MFIILKRCGKFSMFAVFVEIDESIDTICAQFFLNTNHLIAI